MAFRKVVIRLLLTGMSCAALADAANAQSLASQIEAVPFEVPAGALGPALQTFAKQASVEVIFSASQVSGLRTAGVSGRLPPREALARLLQGTGLSIVQDSSGAFLVRPSEGAQQAATSAEVEENAPVFVTGTRIRGASATAPTITLRREDFAQAGVTSVEELFEDLPQNFDEVTPEGRVANEGGSRLRGENRERATAIDLRGLGAQSTLTLMNGVRRAGSVGGRVVDISVIPLSVIDRVEVVTGGRSAVYGADAVAGVVNLVTRRDFDGAESQASFSFAGRGGGEQLQLSQIAGIDRDKGGFVAAYDFDRQWTLDLGDAGLLSFQSNPEIGLTELILQAQSPGRRHSAYLSGHQDVTDNIEIFADTLYSRKAFHDFNLFLFDGAEQNSFIDNHNKANLLSFSGGARADLGSDWRLTLSGGWSSAKNRLKSDVFGDLGGGFVLEFHDVEVTRATMSAASVVMEGPLFSIGGVTPRVAAGAEWRRETFESRFNEVEEHDDHRTVRSLFGELLVPLIKDGPLVGGSSSRSPAAMTIIATSAAPLIRRAE